MSVKRLRKLCFGQMLIRLSSAKRLSSERSPRRRPSSEAAETIATVFTEMVLFPGYRVRSKRSDEVFGLHFAKGSHIQPCREVSDFAASVDKDRDVQNILVRETHQHQQYQRFPTYRDNSRPIYDTEGRHASGQATGQAGRTNHPSRSKRFGLFLTHPAPTPSHFKRC